MRKYKQGNHPQGNRSIWKAVKDSLSHLTIIAVISLTGHFATASLSPLAGALGVGIYPAIGGMSFSYGS